MKMEYLSTTTAGFTGISFSGGADVVDSMGGLDNVTGSLGSEGASGPVVPEETFTLSSGGV